MKGKYIIEELITLADANFSENMKKSSTPTWKEGAKNVDPYIVWSYNKTVCDSSKPRVKKGDYDTTVLSLSKCRKQDLEKKEGYACSNRTIQPWVEVKKSAIENAGMGLFARKRFDKNDIITIYFAPIKSKECPESKIYTVNKFRHFYSIDKNNVPLFMGAHYCNDETWNCDAEDKNHLKEKNNAMLQGFRVVATSRIDAGQEIKFTYNLD